VFKDQIIYHETDQTKERVYLIITGRIELRGYKGDQFKTLGKLADGGTFGEEALYELKNLRKETACGGDDDAWVLELTKDAMITIREQLQLNDRALEWFTINNHIKKGWV
jgi:signal-transduction protein with cAMP-binding, CBS, and nucleotidyltransferase domain